jgi:acyl-CoA hydrolase
MPIENAPTSTNARQRPVHVEDVERCVDAVIADVGKDIVLALPLGLGKAGHFANALYRRAVGDPFLKLTIVTALTLERPTPSSDLEKRLMKPIVARLFDGCAELEYAHARREGSLPGNIKVHEFFFQTGAMTRVPSAQRDYVSSNYTHAVRDLLDFGVNVIGQCVAKRLRSGETRFSLSCNPDITLDLLDPLDARRKAGAGVALVGEVNPHLPFMLGDADVGPETFDYVIESKDTAFRLFSLPNRMVSTADYAAGVHAVRLVSDNGTLQIGIGSIGDAVTYALKLRHERNDRFREIAAALSPSDNTIGHLVEEGRFEKGLYALSEMFVAGFLELYRAGVLRRRVYAHPILQALLNEGRIGETVTPQTLQALAEAGAIRSPLEEADLAVLKHFGIVREDVRLDSGNLVTGRGTRIPARLDDPEILARLDESCLGSRLKGGVVLHGAFFLGPESFYRALNALAEDERSQFWMTAISYTNTLYGDQRLKVQQRRNARFINNAMMATLMGAVVSDGLEDGRVVSGVGGQYNFVAMAHDLEGARSIIILNSTRTKKGRTSSNIVWNYGHTTIPRHLRDLVVTEYGVADLRGKSDADVIKAMLNIADSRFQPELLKQAKTAKKIEEGYEIPPRFRNNTPERIEQAFAPARSEELFPAFPFGSDLTPTEIRLTEALKRLESETAQKTDTVRMVGTAMLSSRPTLDEEACLKRLDLDHPTEVKEKFFQKLVLQALRETAD